MQIKVFFRRLLYSLSPRRKWQLAGLFFLMLVGGFAEILSLGIVVPFLMAASNPAQILEHQEVQKIMNFIQPNAALRPGYLVLLLALVFAMAVILSTTVRSVLLWASVEFASRAGTDLSCEVYRKKLLQPYQIHTTSNSSTLIAALVGKIPMVVNTISSFLTVAASIVMCLCIFTALLFFEPNLACLSLVIVGLSYFCVAWASRREIKKTSDLLSQQQSRVVKALQEGLGGIRDVILDQTQSFYCRLYHSAETGLRRARAKAVLFSSMPKVWVEAVVLLFFATLVGYLGFKEGGLLEALPGLGALALGAQRLLPSIQQGYASWTYIQSARASVTDVMDMLESTVDPTMLSDMAEPLFFRDSIRFEHVKFRYSPQGPWVIDGISFTILKGKRVGIVGKTGTGKSTLLDLLMGLLTPTEGAIYVDRKPLSGEKLQAWRKSIAHVPQAIFLVDGTFAENIAFGIPAEKRRLDRVKQAARQAQIADFIEASPLGYQTTVGERGMRLSGGQRQRIGIARALYKQAQILVFDEATSALDSETEMEVMAGLERLSTELTILIIAHRVTTLKNCDLIIDLSAEKAELVAAK